MKKILTQGCVFYTVLITLVYVIGFLLNDNGNFIPRFRMVWIILGISFVIAAAERLLEGNGKLWFRIGAHFAACLVGFVLIFVVGGGYTSKPSSVVIAVFLFIVVYIVINIFRFALMAKKARTQSEKEEYTKSFQ